MTSKPELNVALVGAGPYGIEIIRDFEALEHSNVYLVQDENFSHLMDLREIFPHISVTADLNHIWTDESVDVVVINLPETSWFELTYAALTAGKHVLLNTVLTPNVEQTKRLKSLAAEKNLVLGLHLVSLYHPVIEEICGMLAEDQIGRLAFITSEQRITDQAFEPDQDFIWNLALADVALALFLMGEMPTAVSATTYSLNEHPQPVVVSILVHYAGGQFSQHLVNQLSPESSLRFQVVGSEGRVAFQPDKPDTKLRVFFRTPVIGQETSADNIAISMDKILPPTEQLSPSQRACEHFAACIHAPGDFRGSGDLALNVVRVLEAASQSSNRGGALEYLSR